MKQQTLKGSFTLFGKGLHTGLSITVTFNPAPENTGYKIQRIDLEGEPIIDAVAENVVDTQRGTVVAKGDVRVSTIEHGMSALYAMGIDNCLIQVNRSSPFSTAQPSSMWRRFARLAFRNRMPRRIST